MEKVLHLTPDEASARLRTPVKTLANWRNRRVGPPYIKAGHRVLYPLDKLEAWEKGQLMQTKG